MYVLLIFTAIFLSFQAAYYAINLQKKSVAGPAEIQEIQGYKKEFELTKKPVLEIDLSAMYPSRRYAQLLQPVNAFSREGNNTKTYFSRPCRSTSDFMSKLYQSKSETWEDFRCNKISELPDQFFETPPLIHESGVSYAYLAFLSGREPFYTPEWVRSNLNLFHAYELEELPARSLEGNFKILSNLKKSDLELLVKGESYIVTDSYFLVRNRQDYNVTYKIFPRTELDSYLKEKVYFLQSYDEGEPCYYKEGRFCWEKDDRTLISVLMQSSIILFIGSIIVLVLIAVILYKKIKQQKFEEERKKHALRVLTHELRTPIANLMLLVESINKESDTIPAHVLEEFLKVEGEVYRLKRLAEKSTSYLQTHDGQSLVFINLSPVPSINELVESMLADYEEKGVKVILPEVDRTFSLDVYWFGICVKNLLENALYHGKSPVVVRLETTDEALTLSVTDSGLCPYKTLDELLSADRSKKPSAGLGLGMSIVQKIMREMDGRLSYNQTPTTFSLFLRNKK
ncbi:histidine kinase/DNA gyrase B/HSP90-like ATPase [Bacteriovorax stolpii]|nr:histidine kinase/DNA gyrase B/HSP90-like ATPase [Bacteriovorax stolpii]